MDQKLVLMVKDGPKACFVGEGWTKSLFEWFRVHQKLGLMV